MKIRTDIDPDVAAVVGLLGQSGERERKYNIRGRHAQQDINAIETKLELLADEVARVIPRNHPHFWLVVMGAYLRKALKQPIEEPEYKSALEEFLF